jgi:tRNA-dihydrouridine synthase
MSNVWSTLESGFLVLAPMEDVTDTVFRQVIGGCGDADAMAVGIKGKKAGQPDVYFTEFTNCDGIMSEGQKHVIHRLKYTKNERPLIAQIWGKTPQNYYYTAKKIVELGFDGVDINMGCPERSVVGQGACSALMKNPDLAAKIIQATKDGTEGVIPVSVKTRIGFNTIDTENWCGFLLNESIDALTVHGRTVKELSEVPAHWDEIGKIVQLRDSLGIPTKIIGNGDVLSYAQAQQYIATYRVDGVMIGRGVFHNPYIFNPSVVRDEHGSLYRDGEIIAPLERLQLLLDHTRLWCDTWRVQEHDEQYYTKNKSPFRYKKNFAVLKKFFKIYCNGFDGASSLRVLLMATNDINEVLETILQSGYEVK